MVRGVTGGQSIGSPWCRETQVSRTAIRLTAVIFSFWSHPSGFDMNSPETTWIFICTFEHRFSTIIMLYITRYMHIFFTNLHFTLGYSLLKCKVDYNTRSVAGFAKGLSTVLGYPISVWIGRKTRVGWHLTNRHRRCPNTHWKSLRQKKLWPLTEICFKSIEIQKCALSNVVCYQSS